MFSLSPVGFADDSFSILIYIIFISVITCLLPKSAYASKLFTSDYNELVMKFLSSLFIPHGDEDRLRNPALVFLFNLEQHTNR